MSLPPNGPDEEVSLAAPRRVAIGLGLVPDPRAPEVPGRATSARARTLRRSFYCGVACLMALILLPVPYVVESPGPTVDTLGRTSDGADLIQVSQPASHDVTGELRLTTVTTRGANRDLPLVQAIAGWISSDDALVPYAAAYPPGSTRQEREEQGEAQMLSSQELSTAAALAEVGETPMLRVASRVTDAAKAALQDGDILLALNGQALPDFETLIGLLGQLPAGSEATLTVRRDGEELDTTMTTADDGSGGSRLGITVGYAFDTQVGFGVEGIGGSSAGLMFTLGIIDKLGPVDLAAGRVIAGTGTVDAEGNVGPIGGIRQKMLGAKRDGAGYFLAPATNCPEVAGAEPAGLEVFSVATVADALAALAAVRAGDTSAVPRCG